MEGGEVLVIGETPSLGRAIADLLESSDVPVRFSRDILSESPLATLAQRHRVVVTACTGFTCDTARRWRRGETPGVHLVVVGSWDPSLTPHENLYVVDLPLRPERFVELIRGLAPEPRSQATATEVRSPAGPRPATTDSPL
jgi:hypothetical protein